MASGLLASTYLQAKNGSTTSSKTIISIMSKAAALRPHRLLQTLQIKQMIKHIYDLQVIMISNLLKYIFFVIYIVKRVEVSSTFR